MSSTSSNTEEFTYNELMEQYVKATRLIEHLKSQRDRSKRAFDKAMDLVLKYDARIAELEAENAMLKQLPQPIKFWSDEKKQIYKINERRTVKSGSEECGE